MHIAVTISDDTTHIMSKILPHFYLSFKRQYCIVYSDLLISMNGH